MASKLHHGVVADTASAVLFTAPGTTQIASFVVTNVTGSAVTLDLWVGAESDANRLLEAESIPANSTVSLSKLIAVTLVNGDEVRALAGAANALTARVSGTA